MNTIKLKCKRSWKKCCLERNKKNKEVKYETKKDEPSDIKKVETNSILKSFVKTDLLSIVKRKPTTGFLKNNRTDIAIEDQKP